MNKTTQNQTPVEDSVKASVVKRYWIKFRRLMAWDGWAEVVDVQASMPLRQQYWRQVWCCVFCYGLFWWGGIYAAVRWGIGNIWFLYVPVFMFLLWMTIRSFPCWLRETKWHYRSDLWMPLLWTALFLATLAAVAGRIICWTTGTYWVLALSVFFLLTMGHVRLMLTGSTGGRLLRLAGRTICKLFLLVAMIGGLLGAFMVFMYMLSTHINPSCSKGFVTMMSGAEKKVSDALLLGVVFWLMGVGALFLYSLLVPRCAELGRYLKIHPARVATGAFRTVLLLWFLFAVTTPLRPLAVKPPPSDQIPSYLLVGYEREDDGRVMRLINIVSDEWRSDIRTPSQRSSNDEMSDIYHDKSYRDVAKRMRRLIYKRDWKSLDPREMDAVLSRLEPVVAQIAEYGRVESPIAKWDFHEGLPDLFPWADIVELLRLDAVRRIDQGDVEKAATAIRQCLDVSVYAMEGDLGDWLIGALLHEIAARKTIRMAESIPLSMNELESIYDMYDDWARDASRLSTAWTRDRRAVLERSQRFLANLYKPDVRWQMFATSVGLGQSPSLLSASSFGGQNARLSENGGFDNDLLDGKMKIMHMVTLVKFSAFLGNDRRGVMQTHNNHNYRLELDVNDAFEESPLSSLLKRGWAGRMHFLPLHGDLLHWRETTMFNSDVALTAIMLSVYRDKTGREAETLEELFAFYDQSPPSVPSAKLSLDYIRLDIPETAAHGTSAYVMAYWDKNHAEERRTVNAWLVVRNPAFGDLPFRIYSWRSGTRDDQRHENNTVKVSALDELTEINTDWGMPALMVPSEIFSDKPNQWDKAEQWMRETGWRM